MSVSPSTIEHYYDLVKRILKRRKLWDEALRKFKSSGIRRAVRIILEKIPDPETFDWDSYFSTITEYDTVDDFIHALEDAGVLPVTKEELIERVSEMEAEIRDIEGTIEGFRMILEEHGIDEHAQEALDTLEKYATEAVKLRTQLERAEAEPRFLKATITKLRKKIGELSSKLAELKKGLPPPAKAPPPPPKPPPTAFYHITADAEGHPLGRRLLGVIYEATGIEFREIPVCEVFELPTDNPTVQEALKAGIIRPSMLTSLEARKLRDALLRFMRDIGVPKERRVALLRTCLDSISLEKSYDKVLADAKTWIETTWIREAEMLAAAKEIKPKPAPPTEVAAPPAVPIPVEFVPMFPGRPPPDYYRYIHQLPPDAQPVFAKRYKLMEGLKEGERLLLMLHPHLWGELYRLSRPGVVLGSRTPDYLRESAAGLDYYLRSVKWGTLDQLLEYLIKEKKLHRETFEAFGLLHLWRRVTGE